MNVEYKFHIRPIPKRPQFFHSAPQFARSPSFPRRLTLVGARKMGRRAAGALQDLWGGGQGDQPP